MNKQFNNIQHLVSKGIIDLEDFYSVTFSNYRIDLQGHMTSERIKGYEEFFEFTTKNGFITSDAIIDGINVSITLT